jgi:hypothetical protein
MGLRAGVDLSSTEAATIYSTKCITSPAGNVNPTQCNAPACIIVCTPPFGQQIQDLYLCADNTGKPGQACNSATDTVC